jgi:hypothetical protein
MIMPSLGICYRIREGTCQNIGLKINYAVEKGKDIAENDSFGILPQVTDRLKDPKVTPNLLLKSVFKDNILQ